MKHFIITALISINIFAQTEYVNYNDPVYNFLERMSNLQLIENYNSFEIPKTRNEIAKNVRELLKDPSKLDESDLLMLDDFKNEYEFELFGTLDRAKSIIGNGSYDIFSDDKKYLYYFSNSSRMNLFINMIGESEVIFGKPFNSDKTNSANMFLLGGELRGTLMDKISFYLRGTNGTIHGNRNTALMKKELQYNFKFNEKPDESFFDETQAYLGVDFNLLKLKLGRDRVMLGYGSNKAIIEDNSPMFDYLSLNINYSFFSFSYLYAKLLGKSIFVADSVSGSYNFVPEKYFAYHRMGFNLSKHADFGIGEIVVYGERSFDLSYLIPFSFFKSVEHSNRDRDNTMLFIDFANRSIPSTKFYFTFLIDDISFNKIGKGWWGNQTLLNVGVQTIPFYKIMPIDFKLEYLRIEPYTYSHRLNRNSFTNLGYNLGTFLQPNSELIFAEISYRFTNRLSMLANFSYTNHGANIVESNGTVKNVGGDINFGHRAFDSETVKFLDGKLETARKISASISFEPIYQIKFFLTSTYTTKSSSTKGTERETQFFIGTNMKF